MKTDPDERVERALLKRALGYLQKEIYSEEIIDRKTGETTGEIKRKIVVKRVPPDVKAAMLWLQNRRPERWNARCDEIADEVETDPEDASLL